MPGGNNSSDEKRTDSPLQRGLTTILQAYVVSRAAEKLNSGHYLWSIAQELQNELARLTSVRRRTNLIVRWSFGQGGWARIPWISLLDQRETRLTSGGVYVIYLFREDMSGVYLTLNQGVTKEKELRGTNDGREFVRQRASSLRKICEGLVPVGFSLNDDIDLRSKGPSGFEYQIGTITHKFYPADNVPDDTMIARDLECVLQVYDAFLIEKLQAN